MSNFARAVSDKDGMHVRAQAPEPADSHRQRSARVDVSFRAALRPAATARPDVISGHHPRALQRMTGTSDVAALLEQDNQPPVHEKIIGSSGGIPLEPEVGTEMRARLGHDFSHVRIHHDDRAHAAATAMGALAYTVGSDIVFQRGGYNPATAEGKLILAHELTHVIQQSQGPVDGAEVAGGHRISSPGDRFERAAAANADRAVRVPVAPDPSGLRGNQRGMDELGGRAVPSRCSRPTVGVLQRQVGKMPRDTKHPENFPTYEGWLSTFAALPTFTSDTSKEQGFKVLGEKAATPGDGPPAPIGTLPGDKFIDHPTDAWVKANLPEELRQTAYRLPADCADIAVILRHVWLFSHHRSEQYGGFTVGYRAGESDRARSERVHKDIAGIDTPQVPSMVSPYSDATGRPLRSIVALAPLLHPGDILLWAHHAGPPDAPADPTRPRSGGHTQTIVSIARTGRTITEIKTVQGNQPLPKETGESLRHTPGRRIEVRKLDNLTDIRVPGKKGEASEQVWSYGDGHTTLVVAGPPKSGERPAAKKEHGEPVRHLADWLPAIAAAPRDRLEGVFEASMREALASLEGGHPAAEVEGEARSLGHAARVRLDNLDAQLAKAHQPPSTATREGIRATLGVLRAGQGSTAAPVVAKVFTAVSAAFEATVPEPGWSALKAGDLNAGERMVDHARRIPLEGLPGPAQAIVVLPAQITGGPQPVDVLLHFHGRNVGYKAGRDISVDEVESQLEGTKRRMLAVLPQGTADAEFGQFDANTYLAAVFAALDSVKIWSPTPPRGSVVLTGHSGGGKVAADLMISGSTRGATELALFDGINGPIELAAIETWVLAQLDGAAAKLGGQMKGVPAKEDKILSTVARLRAYHSGPATARPTRHTGDYPGLHATLKATIASWFDSHGANLSPHAARELSARFTVIATGESHHDRMVGGQSKPGSRTGALQDALTNQ
jgi:hypothetical protein